MSVITVGSVCGSPGETSLVMALASRWPRDVVVIEADSDGGRLAARCDLAVRPGLTELAAAARSGLTRPDDIWRFAQTSAFGVDIVVAHPAAEQVQAALRAAADRIAHAVAELDGVDVLVDVGRMRPGSPAIPLVHAADRRLVASGSRLDDAVSLVHRRDLLESWGTVDLVLSGPGEHSARDFSAAVGMPVLGSRPGRRARRGTGALRRREDRWIVDLAEMLAGSRDPDEPTAFGSDPDGDSDADSGEPLVAAGEP